MPPAFAEETILDRNGPLRVLLSVVVVVAPLACSGRDGRGTLTLAAR
jgi:hypothetical protein